MRHVVMTFSLFKLFFVIDALSEACKELKQQLHVLDEHLVKRVAEEGSTYLDNVKNVPRLYRRTNKEVP